jgi:SpoVK/Ycf46/Vps4 family AAA+-type ATPase
MGGKVGSAEDLLLSLLTYAMNAGKRSILLLDDVESIIGSRFEETAPAETLLGATTSRLGPSEPHLVARNRVLLLSLLELVRRDTSGRIMLICTSRNDWGKTVDRFDRTFFLESPTYAERWKLLEVYVSGFFRESAAENDLKVHDAISNAVGCTTGLSFADMTFQCRNAALTATTKGSGALGFLGAVKSQREKAVPDSLKAGALTDFVDLRVSTFRDLRERLFVSPESERDPPGISLYGSSIECAWDELRRLIVTPICEAAPLHKLMFHNGSSGGKSFTGGILLTGAPGSGKTALAYHCAALAASKNPAVKLLDVSCTSLIHKQVGSSEQAIHRLFVTAKAAAPCILLMDGIENIAAVRGNDNTTEGTMDRVLSTLLTEIDGVDSDHCSIENPACLAIIGITHNPEWIDPALRRPGRLERTIKLGPPEAEARRKIVERELSEVQVSGFGERHSSLALGALSRLISERTEGFTGAEIVAICNDARLSASKYILDSCDGEIESPRSYCITLQHVEEAMESHRAGTNPMTYLG